VDWRQKLTTCQYDHVVKKILSLGILALGLASCNLIAIPSLTMTNLVVDPTTCTPIPATPLADRNLLLSFNFAGSVKSLTISLSYKSGGLIKVQKLEIPELGGTLPAGVTNASTSVSSNTIKLNINLQGISTVVSPSAVGVIPVNPVLPPDEVISRPMDFRVEAKDPDGKASIPSLLEQKAINVASCFTPTL
jgi:hypothetical protein